MAFLLIANVCKGQVEDGCIFIDFESIPNTTTLMSGTPISDQYLSSFGLSFSLGDGNVPVLAQVGSPVEAFGSQWGDDVPAPGVDIGQFFITDDGSLSGLTSSPLILDFSIPIDTFAGCILDVDLSEVFLIEALDASGNVLLSETIRDGDPGTGDGQLTCWGFNLPGCMASITRIRFSGSRTSPGQFGLGMDNFRFCYTGANIEFEVEDFSCDKFGQISAYSTTSEVYEFSLNNIQFSTENIFRNLTPGLYEIFVRDSDGCVESRVVEIEDVFPVFQFADVQNTSCNENNGAMQIIVSPNNGAQFSINNQPLTDEFFFEDLAPDTYQIDVEDDNGCKLDTILVIEPSVGPPEIVNTVVINDFCESGEGSVEILSVGGNGAIQYSINGGSFQDENIFESLSEGTYTIFIIDEDGCTNEVIADVGVGENITLTSIITQPNCFEPNGEFEIVPSGGNGLFTYFFDGSGGQDEPRFADVPPGIYSVTVLDTEGCEASIDVEILDIFPVIQTANIINTNCNEDNGSIEVVITPNNGAQISLNNQSFTPNALFEDLAPGNYQINVKDDNGCLLDTVLVVDPSVGPPEIIDIVVIDDFCGNGGGSIEVASSGGVGNIQFSIDGGSFMSSGLFESLTQGQYVITAIDERDCTSEIIVEVELGDNIILTNDYTLNPDCLGRGGEFGISAIGGNGGFTYFLDTLSGQSSPIFENVQPGTYNILVQDIKGCEEQVTVVIPCTACDLYFPNVITPDIAGPNDRFKIFSKNDYNITVKLYNIYDRWGNLVYTAENFPIQDSNDVWWLGYFDDTKTVSGVYTYLVIVEDGCGKESLYADDLTVLR